MSLLILRIIALTRRIMIRARHVTFVALRVRKLIPKSLSLIIVISGLMPGIRIGLPIGMTVRRLVVM